MQQKLGDFIHKWSHSLIVSGASKSDESYESTSLQRTEPLSTCLHTAPACWLYDVTSSSVQQYGAVLTTIICLPTATRTVELRWAPVYMYMPSLAQRYFGKNMVYLSITEQRCNNLSICLLVDIRPAAWRWVLVQSPSLQRTHYW